MTTTVTEVRNIGRDVTILANRLAALVFYVTLYGTWVAVGGMAFFDSLFFISLSTISSLSPISVGLMEPLTSIFVAGSLSYYFSIYALQLKKLLNADHAEVAGVTVIKPLFTTWVVAKRLNCLVFICKAYDSLGSKMRLFIPLSCIAKLPTKVKTDSPLDQNPLFDL